MKTWILAAVMMVGMAVTAQPRNAREHEGKNREMHAHLKPEQRAELHAKKMTLALNLNDKQQKEVQKLLTEKAKAGEQVRAQHKANKDAGKKLTADEKFVLKNKMLDSRIAMERQMKTILEPAQFEKWESMKNRKSGGSMNRHEKFKKHARR